MEALIKNKIKNQKGFSLPELLIVLLIISILVVLALPQITASRRLLRFSGIQRQLGTSLNEARQNAMSQRKAVTFRYDDANKRIIIYGGSFGALGDAKNQKTLPQQPRQNQLVPVLPVVPTQTTPNSPIKP